MNSSPASSGSSRLPQTWLKQPTQTCIDFRDPQLKRRLAPMIEILIEFSAELQEHLVNSDEISRSGMRWRLG